MPFGDSVVLAVQMIRRTASGKVKKGGWPVASFAASFGRSRSYGAASQRPSNANSGADPLEAVIRYLKAEHRTARNYLAPTTNAVLSAVDYRLSACWRGWLFVRLHPKRTPLT